MTTNKTTSIAAARPDRSRSLVSQPPLPSRQPLPRPDWDPNRRWYSEYVAMLHAANEAIIEQVRLAQRAHALQQELQAARFEVVQVYDLGSADLARIGRELRTKLDAITEELRRRHWPDGEMP